MEKIENPFLKTGRMRFQALSYRKNIKGVSEW